MFQFFPDFGDFAADALIRLLKAVQPILNLMDLRGSFISIARAGTDSWPMREPMHDEARIKAIFTRRCSELRKHQLR